jgi:hypothetical protein
MPEQAAGESRRLASPAHPVGPLPVLPAAPLLPFLFYPPEHGGHDVPDIRAKRKADRDDRP